VITKSDGSEPHTFSNMQNPVNCTEDTQIDFMPCQRDKTCLIEINEMLPRLTQVLYKASETTEQKV